MSNKTVSVPVTGMNCVNCAQNIERAVKKMPGVETSNVNFAADRKLSGSLTHRGH